MILIFFGIFIIGRLNKCEFCSYFIHIDVKTVSAFDCFYISISRGHVYMHFYMSRECVGKLMIDLLFIPCFCYQKRP